MPSAAAHARILLATALALTAAVVWSSYYFFVLYLDGRGVALGPMIAVPFLSGGLAYLALALARGQGRTLAGIARTPTAYGRAGLLVAMQWLVVVGTYAIGPVDTSLLTLVGDTVLTPFLVLSIFREGRERLGSAAFLSGVALCTVGAALAIVAGSAVGAVEGSGWLVVGLLPEVIALYFLWLARLGRTTGTDPLLAHATLSAAAVTLVAALLVPAQGLLRLDPTEIALLAANGLLAFFLGPWLYFRAIRLVGLILPAVLMSTIPVFTLALGFLLDRAVPPALGLAGVPLAVLGAFLAMQGERSAVLPDAGPGPGGGT